MVGFLVPGIVGEEALCDDPQETVVFRGDSVRLRNAPTFLKEQGDGISNFLRMIRVNVVEERSSHEIGETIAQD